MDYEVGDILIIDSEKLKNLNSIGIWHDELIIELKKTRGKVRVTQATRDELGIWYSLDFKGGRWGLRQDVIEEVLISMVTVKKTNRFELMDMEE